MVDEKEMVMDTSYKNVKAYLQIDSPNSDNMETKKGTDSKK